MNNNKLYQILYYISFILTILISIFDMVAISTYFSVYAVIDGATKTTISMQLTPSIATFGIISLILFSIYNILLTKRKLTKTNIICPIAYIAFLISTMILMFIYNTFAIYLFIHLEYYITLILIAYIILNIYSILSIEKTK